MGSNAGHRQTAAAFAHVRVVAAALAVAVAAVTAGAPGNAATPRRIQLVAHDEAVRDVLLRLGDAAHLNVSVADDVKGNVSVSLHDATPDEAVRAVCSQLRLRCVRDGRALTVYTDSSVVVPLGIVSAARAASIVRGMYPRLSVSADAGSNSVVMAGSAGDIAAAKTILQGLDVRDASKPTTEALVLRTQTASTVAARLHMLFPAAKFNVVSRNTMIVSATAPDLTQIKSVIANLDAPSPLPSLAPVSSDAVKVTQRRPQDVARAVSAQIPHVRTAVSGSSVAITGSPEDVNRAKTLIAQLDAPAYGVRYVQIYRIKNVDAKSVAALIQRSFPDASVTVDTSLNGLSVVATAGDQQRIADGIAKLDGTNASAATGEAGNIVAGGGVASSHEIYQLQSIVPNAGYGTATTAQDIAQAVQTALQASNPDLRVVVPNGTTQVILTGSPQSVRAGRELLAELDIPPMSVVLDTEILELDENSSRNLGLQLLTTSIGSTFSEILPPAQANGNPSRLIGPQALTRTGVSFQAQVNLLISNGKARVLADPRITTVSGRTATIRAGDSISILTTIGGGSGTVATSQLQTFQTGVTLDITPIITSSGAISVALHPVVNSLTGYLNGVPQISTRDTQTSVRLRDNETLVIGGLIQESSQRSESKIPILGDLPLIGRAFRNQNATSTRNELIIVVTPHLLYGNETSTVPSAAIPPGMTIPTPKPLPTLPANAAFPTPPSGAAPAKNEKAVKTGTPAPSASTSPAAAASPGGSPSPFPTPTAFAQANVYVFGSPPPSTYAGPGDAPQIFYVMVSPTVLTPNATVRVSAITTTNVQRVTIGSGPTTIGLSPLGAGKWQGVFAANALSPPPTATTVQLTLTASRGDGQSSNIQIPVSLMREQPVL